MNLTFELQASELTSDFAETIKRLFKQRLITINITENTDTTNYLLSTEANSKHLEKSISETETINFTYDEFIKHSQEIAVR